VTVEISGRASVAGLVSALDGQRTRVELATPGAVEDAAKTLGRVYQAVGDKRSGRMVGSYRYRMTGAYEAEAGPTIVYGRRNEIGFHGPDSDGRHFHQRGHYGLRLAVDVAGPEIAAQFVRVWMQAVNG
jgi:hypothetical protein